MLRICFDTYTIDKIDCLCNCPLNTHQSIYCHMAVEKMKWSHSHYRSIKTYFMRKSLILDALVSKIVSGPSRGKKDHDSC